MSIFLSKILISQLSVTIIVIFDIVHISYWATLDYARLHWATLDYTGLH